MLQTYIDNINYLLNMPQKDKYDKLTKYIIGNIGGKDIYTTEFLIAKQFGYLKKFQGHSELKDYMKLIPLIVYYKFFDEVYKNIDDNRKIYVVNDTNGRKIFHVIDQDYCLVSVFIVSKINFEKQLNRRFSLIKDYKSSKILELTNNLNGGTATPHILSPARPFWRHLDLLERLYQKLQNMSNTPRQINTIGRYWRKKYNTKVYKIPISISGFTCPNIDGTVAKGGCTFCENESFSPNLKDNSKLKLNLKSTSNPFLEQQLLQLETQFQQTKAKLIKKFNAKKFIVYFQSFTNTYAPFETLKALYSKALEFDDVIGISIGTRADSITDETLDYLSKLNQTKEIWVEYGIQSIYDTTLQKVNRGEDFNIIEKIIRKTKNLALNVCGHLIFGLPDETQEMMLQSVRKTVELGVDSIKFHPLYVVKNTLLTNDYKKGKFTPISEELYIDTLVKAVKLLPDTISIQRVTAGIDDDTLLSPLWCKNKHNQINKIKKALLKENLLY